MERLLIKGGRPLRGYVKISGMKNAAVAVIFATVAVGARCVIENVPEIRDVELALKMLRSIGAVAERVMEDTVVIDTSDIFTYNVTTGLEKKMRASYYLLGGLLGRFGDAVIGIPGGCDFGDRPIDQHIKAFERFGAGVISEGGRITAHAENGLKNGNVFFDCVTVGGTVNAMIAASVTEGMTILGNVAREPHIVDLANFLNFCGADIRGAGTDTIKINGRKKLHGCTYCIIPDMIEAGTFMCSCVITHGALTLGNIIPKHLEATATKLCEAGAVIKMHEESLEISHSGVIYGTSVNTMPYPGFPTDMNPQMTAVLSLADGVSRMNENIWDNRFKYTGELIKMGADIVTEGNTAIIRGVKELFGTDVRAVDLRAGAAMAVAALGARGETRISDIELIERGYEHFTEKLASVGADIKKTDV